MRGPQLGIQGVLFRTKDKARHWISDQVGDDKQDKLGMIMMVWHPFIPSTPVLSLSKGMNTHIQLSDGKLRKAQRKCANRTKCNKVYNMHKTLQNVHIVQFVTNFTKTKFLKKCKNVRNIKGPRWTNGTNRREEQKRAEEKEPDELLFLL